jgi:hypothetical protein
MKLHTNALYLCQPTPAAQSASASLVKGRRQVLSRHQMDL